LKTENAALDRTARTKASLMAGMEVKGTGPTGLEGIVPLEDEGVKDPARQKNGTPEKKEPGDFEKGIAGMLGSKEAREFMMAQAGAQLEMQYRDLFDELQLDPAKRDAVLEILKSRMASQIQDGMNLISGSQSAEDKKAAADRLAAAAKETEEKLKAALGPEAYSSFDRYEKSQPEREQLKVLNSMLKSKDLALNEAAETQLMDVLYKTRTEFRFDHDYHNPLNVTADAYSDGSIERFMQQQGELQTQVQEKVRSILTPEQFDVFVQSQKTQTEMMRMGMKMFQGTSGADGKD
jgi:hypothetical protein